jgi:gluconokinase
MLIILFGLSGVGKNYIGNIIAQSFPFVFWDGDEALTPMMKQYIAEQKVFTQAMRDEFCPILIDEIKQRMRACSNLVVAQGLYKEVNRKQILAAVPDARLIHVTADLTTIQNRLANRHQQINIDYGFKISQAFEPPQLCQAVIQNNVEGQEQIQSQLREILCDL